MPTRLCDLPKKLVGKKILTRIPITSLSAVRSTCKSWEALTKKWILGKAGTAAKQQFLGFMTMNSKVCSLRFHRKQKGDLIDLSINQVDLFNQVEISKVFHCDGLLLCVVKDNSKLVVWNPYLCQTRWIGPRKNFEIVDKYALGYDMNRNHKILRFVDNYINWSGPDNHLLGFEIYEFSSNSWRVLKVTPNWEIEDHHLGVSVKGNTYFFAHEKIEPEVEERMIFEIEDFLLCFDFTRERFGPRLPLPFHSYSEDCVTLSRVRDEQLAVLYYKEGVNDNSSGQIEIWVTTTIEPNCVSWSKFFKVKMRPFALTGVKFDAYNSGSFFLDEEDKVAVVFDLDGYLPPKTPPYHTAFIIGEDGYFESVGLGEATNLGERCPITGYLPEVYRPALVCSSSYRPSLVQVNQPPRKRKERDF